MPFLLSALEQGILDLLQSPPKTVREAAFKISKSYADFVSPTVGAGAPASFTGIEVQSMANIIAPNFRTKGNIATSVVGIVSGVQAFWLAPPVIFGASVVSLWTGGPALQGCLLSIINPKVTARGAAKRVANCFDIATKLVFVQPPGPVPPVPIA